MPSLPLADPGAPDLTRTVLGGMVVSVGATDTVAVATALRLHTASDTDRVAVVEDGQVTELGRHDELLRLGGSGARWASRQSA